MRLIFQIDHLYQPKLPDVSVALRLPDIQVSQRRDVITNVTRDVITYLENEVTEGGQVGSIPSKEATLYFLYVDRLLVSPLHLVDQSTDVHHSLHCHLYGHVTRFENVVIVQQILMTS